MIGACHRNIAVGILADRPILFDSPSIMKIEIELSLTEKPVDKKSVERLTRVVGQPVATLLRRRLDVETRLSDRRDASAQRYVRMSKVRKHLTNLIARARVNTSYCNQAIDWNVRTNVTPSRSRDCSNEGSPV